MGVKDIARSNAYMELIRELPLVSIRSAAHLKQAQAMIDRLLQKDLDEGGQEYLDALSDLVEVYEDEHVKIPDASEADVLRLLMESNGLTQTALAQRSGIGQPTISAVLHGTRTLTKQQMITLARLFHVAPAVFLPAR